MTLRKSYVSESLSFSPDLEFIHLIKKVPLPQTIPLALHKYSNGTAIKKPSTSPDGFKWQVLSWLRQKPSGKKKQQCRSLLTKNTNIKAAAIPHITGEGKSTEVLHGSFVFDKISLFPETHGRQHKLGV